MRWWTGGQKPPAGAAPHCAALMQKEDRHGSAHGATSRAVCLQQSIIRAAKPSSGIFRFRAGNRVPLEAVHGTNAIVSEEGNCVQGGVGTLMRDWHQSVARARAC